MKIVDVCEFYAERGGGVRSYVNRKLEAGRAHGVEVVIIAPGPEDRTEARLGGTIRWVAGPPMPFDPRYFVLHREAAVHRILDEERPDLIEGSSVWTSGWFAARYQARRATGGGAPRRTPRVLVFHQDPVAVYPHTLLDRWVPRASIDRAAAPVWSYVRSLAARFDATIVAGDWLAERLGGFGIKAPIAVPFGIAKATFRSDRRSADVRRALLAKTGLDPATYADDGPRRADLLVAVSRHHPEKRLGTVIGAVSAIGALRGRPAGLVIFGDGPLRRRVERLAARVPHVHVAGVSRDADELADALASSDAFVHGSAAETYGLVVAEALASGLPLVVPSVGGAADLASPAWAETYPPGDSAALAEAAARLLARRESAAAAARGARDLRVLDVSDHFTRLFDTYRALASR